MAAKNAYYDILGLTSTASEDEIKRAWKKAALQHHPDKGGDPDKFKQLSKAYEVLSDPDKRRMYDQFGEQGIDDMGDGGGFPGGDMGSLFASLFGGGGGFGFGMPGNRQRPTGRRAKGPNQEQVISVKLADLYNGTTIAATVNQKKFCTQCKGKGGNSHPCAHCHGTGMVTQIQQMGPGMIAQSTRPCTICRGEGTTIKDTCTKCKGAKLFDTKKTLNVVIKPGMADGETIMFQEECSDTHGADVAGDLIFHLKQIDDPVFTRDGNKLYAEISVPLVKALLGFTVTLPTHPRGTPIIVTHSGPIQPGQVITIDNAGMPWMDGRKQAFGQLHVTVNVVIPSVITAGQKAFIKAAFPDETI